MSFQITGNNTSFVLVTIHQSTVSFLYRIVRNSDLLSSSSFSSFSDSIISSACRLSNWPSRPSTILSLSYSHFSSIHKQNHVSIIVIIYICSHNLAFNGTVIDRSCIDLRLHLRRCKDAPAALVVPREEQQHLHDYNSQQKTKRNAFITKGEPKTGSQQKRSKGIKSSGS